MVACKQVVKKSTLALGFVPVSGQKKIITGVSTHCQFSVCHQHYALKLVQTLYNTIYVYVVLVFIMYVAVKLC